MIGTSKIFDFQSSRTLGKLPIVVRRSLWIVEQMFLLAYNILLSFIIKDYCKVYNFKVSNYPEYLANGLVVHNCEDCITYAADGWRPIGTLPPIGDSVCGQYCKCTFEYSVEARGDD